MIDELDAVAMYADWTDYNEEIKSKLEELNSRSILASPIRGRRCKVGNQTWPASKVRLHVSPLSRVDLLTQFLNSSAIFK